MSTAKKPPWKSPAFGNTALSVLLAIALAVCMTPAVALAEEDALPDAAGLGAAATALDAGAQAALPEKFDLRDKGFVSPVKNQDPWGTCWAFATTAASESSILSELGTSYKSNPLDFSVRHLAWFAGTALPDAATMRATPSLAPYASQAGEGTTVRSTSQNTYAHPLETGGFAFYAATTIAAGTGPILAAEAPYKNDEGMAEYVFNENDKLAVLEPGQTFADFLQKNPGQYRRFAQHDASQDDDEGPGTTTPRQGRVEATPELAKSGAISRYAVDPIFDSEGRFIAGEKKDGPVYTWGVSEDKRFSHAYELEACHVLAQPTGGYEGQQYAYNKEATEAIKRELLAGRAVAVSVFDDSQTTADENGYSRFTNRNTWSQYTMDYSGASKIQGSAHVVCIVGWDDTWGTGNFVQGSVKADDGKTVSRTPPAAGAWIVKNSYGFEGAGFPNEGTVGYLDAAGKHSGFIRLSYYDMSISRPTSFDYDVSGRVSDVINQYDLMPAPVVHAEKRTEDTSFANVFTASQDQLVRALSVESELAGTHAKLELWRLGEDATTPTDGERVATVEADLEHGGFYRLNLDKGYRMQAGGRFAVVGTLTTTAGGKTTYQVPVHRDVNVQSIEKYGDKIETYVKGVVNNGESYLRSGGTWKDWAQGIADGKRDGSLVSYYDYDNFSLKAYAEAADPLPDPQPSPAPAPAGGKVGKSYKVSGSTYKVTSNSKNTVTLTRAKKAKSFTVPASVVIGAKAYKVTAIGQKAFSKAKGKLKSVAVGKNVKTIGKSALAGCKKAKTITVKTKKLTKKSVKGSLSRSSVKTVKVKVGSAKTNKSYVKKYAKIFTKKNCGRKVAVKR